MNNDNNDHSLHNHGSENIKGSDVSYGEDFAPRLTRRIMERENKPVTAQQNTGDQHASHRGEGEASRQTRPVNKTHNNGQPTGQRTSNPRPVKSKQGAPKHTAQRQGATRGQKSKKVSERGFIGRFFWCLKWIVRIVIIVFFSLIFACLGAGLGIYICVIRDAPALEILSIQPDAYTSFVYDKDNNQIDEFHGEENRIYVKLDEIPVDLQNAFIAIEDERFYKHNGIDLRGIARAAYQTFSGTSVQGASTLTQQLIKNNVTKVTRNNFETKIQEQYLAIQYESMLTEELGSKEAAKKYLLELYLNTINLSHGYNGVEAAAEGYYNKDVSELDLAESAVIAAITNNPYYYSPRTNPEHNKERQTDILDKMLEQGYITQEAHDAALEEDVYSSISQTTKEGSESNAVIHTYFIDSLFDQVSEDLQNKYNMSSAQANYVIYNGGLQIYSTFDKNIQNILDQTFADDSLFPNARYCLRATYNVSVEDSATGKQEHSEFNKYVRSQEEANDFVASKKAEIEGSLASGESIVAEKSNFTVEPQAAMVIEDYRTGYVPALIGGRGAKTVNRGFNRATDSARQPGSVFKVLAAYAPGIDSGKLTAATPIEDSPFKVGNYEPSNWWGKSWRGMANPRKGIQDSMNVVTVKAMDMVGVDTCYEYLENFGFTTLENDAHLSTALGGITNGVTQLEVTAAYGTIANGGVYKKPTLYTKVLDHNGNVLLDYDEDFEDREVLSSGASFVLIDMMKDVITKGTGTAAAFQNINMPLAGKTGTTTDTKDLTFVGITPYYVAGIWLGYDSYDDTVRNMEGLNERAHEVVWRTCMEKVHQGLEYKEFEMPDDVVQVYVCSYSGLLPNGCSGHNEYFVKGTEPTEYCKGHYARLYLDDKYYNSGYGYDPNAKSSDYSGSSSNNYNNNADDDEDEDNVAPAEDDEPSADEIENAYEAEFGDLDDSAPVPEAPVQDAPVADTPPADSGQEVMEEPVH